MESMLCDLVRVLTRSTALRLRQRADEPLNRAETLAVATLLDLAGAVLADGHERKPVPTGAPGDDDLAQIELAAQADLRVVEAVRRSAKGV